MDIYFCSCVIEQNLLASGTIYVALKLSDSETESLLTSQAPDILFCYELQLRETK
jgi:hypothetical protein